MLVMKIILSCISGGFIAQGLFLQTIGTVKKAKKIKNNDTFWGICLKFSGFVILAYLLINFKTQNLICELFSFFASILIIILMNLLARRRLIG
jgi:hypothetical protein